MISLKYTLQLIMVVEVYREGIFVYLQLFEVE
jgi:hypothetical protein